FHVTGVQTCALPIYYCHPPQAAEWLVWGLFSSRIIATITRDLETIAKCWPRRASPRGRALKPTFYVTSHAPASRACCTSRTTIGPTRRFRARIRTPFQSLRGCAAHHHEPRWTRADRQAWTRCHPRSRLAGRRSWRNDSWRRPDFVRDCVHEPAGWKPAPRVHGAQGSEAARNGKASGRPV